MPKNKNKNDKWKLSRRDFLKLTGAAGAGGTLLDWAVVGPNPALAATVDKVVRNICSYCSIGCGLKVSVSGSQVVDVYGDEDHVISRGALCSKGSALLQLVNSTERVGVPGSTKGPGPQIKLNGTWHDVTWKQIFEGSNLDGTITLGSVNVPNMVQAMTNARASNPDSVAFWGSSHMTNEECYLYRKLITLFGTNNVEHQARI